MRGENARRARSNGSIGAWLAADLTVVFVVVVANRFNTAGFLIAGLAFGLWVLILLSARAFRRRRSREPLTERFALSAASLFIPAVVRGDWLAETASFLYEAAPEKRRAWCWDLVRRAPLTGAELAYPRLTARVRGAVEWLRDCGRDPSSFWVSVRRAVDAAALSRIGYILLSVVPVLVVGGIVWLHEEWFAVIENADNLGVIAAAIQAAVIMLRRDARRRRDSTTDSAT